MLNLTLQSYWNKASAPASARSQQWFYAMVCLLICILGLLHSYYLRPLFFPLDDAYIVLHNAQVLHSGFDQNYPGVPALAGTTSPIHLLLVYLLTFWLAPPAALETTQWLGILLYALGILRLAFIYRASHLQAALILCLALITSFTPFQLLDGLETGLAMAAVTWSLALAAQPLTTSRRRLAALLCGLLPFLRPELALFSLLLFAYRGWQYWQDRTNYQNFFIALRQDCAWMLLAALPWILWYWIDTGLPYPSTIGAKYAFFAEFHQPLLNKLHVFSKILYQFILVISPPLILMIGCLFFTPAGRTGFLFLAMFLANYAIIQPLILSYNYYRYLWILLPILLFGGISVMRHATPGWRYLINGLFLLAFLQQLLLSPLAWKEHYLWHLHLSRTEYPQLANWCQTHLPKNAIILIHDAGYLAYATHFHLVDMVGLKTPENIAYHRQLTLPSAGKQRAQAISLIAQHSHAQYLVVIAGWNKGFHIAAGLQALGWQLQLLRKPSLPAGYWVYRIRPY